MGFAVIHPVTVDLVKTTISIRQEYKIKLPDALIAATAIVSGIALLSRNISDFGKIEGLQVIDPYNL